MRIERRFGSRNRQFGQGMTEYIIIVALIAIAAIGVYTAFGKVTRGQMSVMTSELAGQTSASGRTATTQGTTKANTQAAAEKNLSNYEASNRGN
ncbi:pilus assembly protein [Lysobacter korlensis]|uniref:Pilus assembly protein n=1 Tax=Lysobacter korlensis TaxID=553636 RepID=A0ABV6RHU3_9GAMM